MARATGRVSSGDPPGAGVYRQPGISSAAPGKIDLIPRETFLPAAGDGERAFAQARPESHKQFIDIQYLISGEERMVSAALKAAVIGVGRGSDAAEDILFWHVEDAGDADNPEARHARHFLS